MKEMKDKEKWMDALKERLDDYSEPMPASGWERLEREMVPSVEKRIYPYRRWAVAAAAVVLVAASSVSLYLLNSPVGDEMRHVSIQALSVAPDLLPEPSLPDVQIAKVEPMKPIATSTGGSRVLAKSEPAVKMVEAETKEESKQDETAPSVSETTTTKQEVVIRQPEKKQAVRRPSGRDKLHLPEKTSASGRGGKWSMGLSVGNAGGTSSNGDQLNVGTGFDQRVALSDVASNTVAIPVDKELVFENGVPYLKAPREVPEIEHHLPISVGLSVRKALPKGFSVETGLTYTLLSSDISLPGNKKMQSQKLHYIGIPLRANWNFFEKKLFTFYVSGGGLVEKCVSGRVAGENLNVKPLQFSVAGAVGAQYNANQHIGIYVEPGVSYFFDDGSSVQTIRKETPFNFNLQAGVRFTY